MFKKNHRKEKTSSKRLISISFLISVVIAAFLINASVVAGESYLFVSKWGSYGSGDGQFDYPTSVAVDSLGNVYVADTNNHRIEKFDSNGNFITKWGSFGYGDGQLYSPEGVAVDSSGNVYVADFNQRIQKFDSNGNFITKWGSGGYGDGQFSTPKSVAVDSLGNVYVADTNNYRIQKFDSNGNFITKWGSFGYGNGQFSTPKSVAADSSGNIYVADTGNHRIQKFDSNGNFITKIGGTAPGSGDGEFNDPAGVTVDSLGNVYVADTNNQRIQKFDSNINFITKWGASGSGDGQFGSPYGVAADASDYVYASDSLNHRIQKFVRLPYTPIITVCSAGCNSITIQGAINAAVNGNTVLVSAGTYTENINFSGKAITVKSEKGASQTIINGGGLGTVVTFGSGEGANSILDGFTIKGGSADYGGGISINNYSSPIIKNNIITGNTASYNGQWGGNGGGISVYWYSSPTITNNTIAGNTSSFSGGGITIAGSSSPVITNNIVWGNSGTQIEDNPSEGANTITVTYNIVQGGYIGTGNINTDPLFVDPANGDYHLQSGSPAIDTGRNTSAPSYGSVTDDIIGTIRPQDGDGFGAGTTGDGSDYDIGAYEYKTSLHQTYTLTITKTGTGSGTVTSSPAGIDCGADCSEAYNSGTIVTLTPTPNAGSFFTNWSGDADCSDGQVTMDINKTCTALFTLNAYNLNVLINPSIGGVVTAPGINCPGDCTESYNYGNNVTLTATANTGYTFNNWTNCDSPSGNQCTMTMNSDKTVTANFTSTSIQYALSISKGGNGTGLVTSSPAGINCGTDCQEAYNSGTIVILTATPDAGSTFSYWSGDADCSDGVVTTNGSKTCWAIFKKPILEITRSGTGTGTVTSSPAGINCGSDCSETYNLGTSVTLTPTPDSGSIFSYWRGDADCSDGVVTMDVSKSCGAVFERPVFGLAIEKGGNGTGTVTSSPAGINCGTDCYEIYDANTTVTLTATPDSGSTFSYWSGDADCSDGVVTTDGSKTCWAIFNTTP